MPTLYRGYGAKVFQKYPVTGSSVVVGRDPTCEVRLTGAGVSRRHCQLVRGASGYVIEDLGSSNGTFVNGVKIEGQRALQEGDRIVVMGHLLTYHVADEPIGPAESPLPEESSSKLERTPSAKAQVAEADGVPAHKEFTPTEKLDPKEILDRLNKLLEEEGFNLGRRKKK